MQAFYEKTSTTTGGLFGEKNLVISQSITIIIIIVIIPQI